MASVEQRPQFYEEQYLEAADLAETVDYARSQLSRAQLAGHTWGIALGLEIVEDTLNRNQPYITPGYAWDGFGRPIIVTSNLSISESLFAPVTASHLGEQQVIVDVWIGYTEQGTRSPKPGFQTCSDSTGAQSRVIESVQIFLGTKQGAAQHSEVQVGGVSFDAAQALSQFNGSNDVLQDASVPFQDLPQPQERFWLIPLGSVSWSPTAGTFKPRSGTELSDSKNKRRYSGLVGESIETSAGHVRVHDRTKPYSLDSTSELLWVEGDARFDGNVRLYEGKSIEFPADYSESSPSRFRILQQDDLLLGNALRVVIGSENKGINRLSVGPKTDSGFVDAMVVTDQGRVGVGRRSPAFALDVDGDIQCSSEVLFSPTSLHAVGAQSKLRSVCGSIDKNGNVLLGGGFHLAITAAPAIEYVISFDPVFTDIPAATVTLISNPSAKQVSYVTSLVKEVMVVSIRDRNGTPIGSGFSFIVVGPR
jgi:hypothetical protein